MCKELGIAPPPSFAGFDAVFSACDKNEDGVLDTDEWAAVYRHVRAQVFKVAAKAMERARQDMRDRECCAIEERGRRRRGRRGGQRQRRRD